MSYLEPPGHVFSIATRGGSLARQEARLQPDLKVLASVKDHVSTKCIYDWCLGIALLAMAGHPRSSRSGHPGGHAEHCNLRRSLRCPACIQSIAGKISGAMVFTAFVVRLDMT